MEHFSLGVKPVCVCVLKYSQLPHHWCKKKREQGFDKKKGNVTSEWPLVLKGVSKADRKVRS